MKHWPTFAFVVAGLSFVLYFQVAPRFHPIDTAAAAVNAPRPTPPRPAASEKKESPALTFGGYPCPGGDCAEDQAGYQWAARNRINDPDDCTGTTAAFIEGCRVYAQRRAATPAD